MTFEKVPSLETPSNAFPPESVNKLSVSSPPPTPPDADLVARCLRGDADAFDVLVRRYYRSAFAVALGVLGNRQDADVTLIAQDQPLRVCAQGRVVIECASHKDVGVKCNHRVRFLWRWRLRAP